ncbi:TcpQ domain-containing protein [Neptuniibacter halophilus]|uniref:TcpQ domain-containing protein n=1 Tax=Neptuniibacter halophilus TaxID=651666 RepID=UPI002573ABEA|nr:TcpQ domain-containing protein [Neptuniibacter halophilus]
MNRKVIFAAIAVALLPGCQALTQISPPSEPVAQDKPAYSNVESVSDLLVPVTPGSLEQALTSVAEQAGLTLRYSAEPLFHKRSGALRGSAAEVAQQLVAGLPLRVFVTGKTLVTEQMWSVSTGLTVKNQLKKWDDQSQWSVVWETRKGQTIQANAYFFGTFDMAVEGLFSALQNDGSDLEPEYYSNKTVVIR